MSEANKIQHGGDHYRKKKMQHWDFAVKHNIGYLEGCATKYISRHRDKNGREDLQKAAHYLLKIQESFNAGLYFPSFAGDERDCEVFSYSNDLTPQEHDAFTAACLWKDNNDLSRAIASVEVLIGQYG